MAPGSNRCPRPMLGGGDHRLRTGRRFEKRLKRLRACHPPQVPLLLKGVFPVPKQPRKEVHDSDLFLRIEPRPTVNGSLSQTPSAKAHVACGRLDLDDGQELDRPLHSCRKARVSV